MTSVFEQVAEFHQRFDMPVPKEPGMPDNDMIAKRLEFMHEELCEFMDAAADNNMVGMFDAILDLIYVAAGTGLYMGLSAETLAKGFEAVHDANMEKIKVVSADDSKRGTAHDVKKPPGWVGPETFLAFLIARQTK